MAILGYSNSYLLSPGGGYYLGSYDPKPDPYNPLNLPPNTVRVRTSDGNPPPKVTPITYDTATRVPGTTDVYDIYKSGKSFLNLLYGSVSGGSNVIEVLGANTSGITNMDSMFLRCTALSAVPIFDTRSVTNMQQMFGHCSALSSVPLFNTSGVISMYAMFDGCTSLTAVPLFDTTCAADMDYMFKNCYKVESGALALYQQASTQVKPPHYHNSAFVNCGRDTVAGAAELAQIPSGWK